MKRLLFVIVACAVVFLALFLSKDNYQTEERAQQRLAEYAHAINYDYETPEEIYPFLCESFRTQMTAEEFCACWEKERTYPYLTPVYLMKNPELTLNEDLTSGTATYIQAARLEGMTYDVGLVFENGDWYIQDWKQFLDGSYLEKFEDLFYSLDWYFNTDPTKD